MPDMTRVETAGRIDLREWDFGFGALDALVAEAVSGFIEDAFKEDAPDASLPFVWGPKGDGSNGPAVEDPMMIYVGLDALAGLAMEGPVFCLSLETLIEDAVDGAAPMDGSPFDAEAKEMLGAMSARLRELADLIDKAVQSEEKDAA